MKTKENEIRIKIMKTSRSHYGFLVLCLGIISVGACCYVKIWQLPRSKQAALFVFGSSLFDVGNNNYINTTADNQANYWPYGETFFKFPTGRFSDGRLIPDFIAEYAKLPLTLPYLYPGYQRYIDGVNFASAGAGALEETRKGQVISLKTQLTYFKNVRDMLRRRIGDAETKKLVSEAVYLFNIGTNDYAVRVTENSTAFPSYSPKEYVDMVIGNLTNVVKEIHRYGGRKFGFLGLANLGCYPVARANAKGEAGSCVEESSAQARLHNTALSVVLPQLERQLKGFLYSFTNLYDSFTEVINHPSKYGFTEANAACCGSGPYRGNNTCGGRRAVKEYELCENSSDYVFFDAVHFTERANKFFAQQMWSGHGNITWPYNLQTLFQI